MRRFLIGFGACAAVVVILLIGAFAYVAVVGGGLDAEAKAFAETSVTAITGHWDSDALLARSTDALKASLTEARTRTLFGVFGQLGPLSARRGCNGQASMFRSITGPGRTVASYICTATYQNGQATISLALEKHADAWLINGFHVNSDTLLQQQPSTKL